MAPSQESKPFEIGLVMAGAVSAGAYTAGVIDFLLQALEEWNKKKEAGAEDAQPHEVKIKTISGASAGGMTGAILTAMLNEDFEHITCMPGREPTPEEVRKNKLYNAWVEQVDISKLLGNRDLRQKGSKVKSLLDSTVLNDIADETIRFSPNGQWRPYIAKPLHLYVTVTNLQGVPYDIEFVSTSDRVHTVAQHTDFLHFILETENTQYKEAERLDAGNDQHPNWEFLKSAALATGAFPGGLAARQLSRSFEHYNFRSWTIPQRPEEQDGRAECTKTINITPSWPEGKGQKFNFLSVDGGVMDNEPMELARRSLAGENGFNPRDPENAQRAVIMVDPFPNESRSQLKNPKELEEYDLVNVFAELFGSLMGQARFKPDELMLANSDEVYSRFMIAPTRYSESGTKAQYPIASGFLGGFGGFFSEKFRMHDFQLGRRNCQQFLAKYLAIPVEKAKKNAVFADYDDDDFERFAFQRGGQSYIPLIPLMGSAREEAHPLRWNTLQMQPHELDELEEQVADRTKLVINRLLEQYIGSAFVERLAKIAVSLKRGAIVGAIMKKIKEELSEFDLKA